MMLDFFNYFYEFPYLINIISTFIVIILLIILKSQRSFFLIIYLSIFSILLCLLYLLLDAPDVAMTEAALGAALTTVIFTNVIKK